MRVILNGLSALKPKTGVGHYIDSLYRHLKADPDGGRVDFYPRGWARRLARRACDWLLARKKGKPAAGRGGGRSRLGSLVAGSKHFARAAAQTAARKNFQAVCAANRFDLYHEPNFIPWPCDLPTVLTVHDLSVLLYPEWHPAERVRAHEAHFFRGLGRCRHFIAVSEFTRREMIDKLGVAPGRVTAVLNGIRPRFRPLPPEQVRPALAELGVPPNYLLYLGTVEPRKNVLTLLRAYCALPSALRERFPLLLVGGWGWTSQDVLDYYQTTARHMGVIHHGYLPDPYLPALYNGARALVYPSFYEGFGFPPLEMMACGGAVLASTAGALREVLPADAPLVEPLDADGWRDALAKVMGDDDWWMGLRAGAPEFAGRYTWEASARQTWVVYRECGR